MKVRFTERAPLSPTCTSGGGKEGGLVEADRERQTVTCRADRVTCDHQTGHRHSSSEDSLVRAGVLDVLLCQ